METFDLCALLLAPAMALVTVRVSLYRRAGVTESLVYEVAVIARGMGKDRVSRAEAVESSEDG